MMKNIAYFGGTFDPVHTGHLLVARQVTRVFDLDKFYFLPAFHAPHKSNAPSVSSFHRFAMLALATAGDDRLAVSPLELDARQRRYTVDTLEDLRKFHPADRIFFVMGADSWSEITTWRDWERLLLTANHIVVTRPGYEIEMSHVTDAVIERIKDVRDSHSVEIEGSKDDNFIYVTNAANFDTSATVLREDLSDGVLHRIGDVPAEVAKYIEKYELYS